MKSIINKTTTIMVLSLLSAITASAQAWTGANGTSFQAVLNTNGTSGNTADSTGYGSVNYDYSIGTYEVTNSQYVNFLNSVGGVSVNVGGTATSIYGGLDDSTFGGIVNNGGTYEVRADKDNNAVNYVSGYASAMYTNWLSNGATDGADYLAGVYDFNTYGISIDVFANADHSAGTEIRYMLPTENEWYKAAYYDPETQKYSLYANQKDSITGTDANYRETGKDNVTDIDYGVDSFYGTFGQSGNVWELNEAIVNSSTLGLRGGSFFSNTNSLGSDYRNNYNPSHDNNTNGFRVSSLAAIPEPSTYAMIFGFFALGFAYYRKRK